MTDDRQLLNDYALWSNAEPDKSIDAFLAERKAEADARRVEEAVRIVDEEMNTHSAKERAEDRTLSYLDDVLRDVRSALIDDSTLTERRTHLA